MRRLATYDTSSLLTALGDAAAVLWCPVRNAIMRATRLERLTVRFEGRRRAQLARFYGEVLSFVPAECATARRELEAEITKLCL